MSSSSKKSVTSDDYVKLKFPNSPTTDGKRCIFSIREINEDKNQYQGALYLKVLGENGYRQFTSGTHYDTTPKFSPSGEFVAFLSSRSKKGKQVYIIPINGGEAFQVTNMPKGVIEFSWSHDSKYILVIARVNSEELENLVNPKKENIHSYVLEPVEFSGHKSKKDIQKKLRSDPRVITEAYCRELTSYLDGRFSQPFIFPIPKIIFDNNKNEKGKIRHIGEFGYHYTLGAFSLDDQHVFLLRYFEDPSLTLNQDILKVSVSNSTSIKLGEAFGRIQNINLSPDGKYLSFEGTREEEGIFDDTQIFLVDTNTHTILCLTENYNRSSVQSQWYDRENLLFLSPADGRINLHKININTFEVNPILVGDRNINSFAVSPNKNCIVYSVSHVSFPSDIFWSDGEGKNEERITEANKNYLLTHNIAKSEGFTFERESIEFQGWILKPRNSAPQEKLPVVLEIHGGPAVMWTPHEITLWHEWNVLVNQGYAIVFCNPRGSDGYGAKFRKVKANWSYLPAADILKGLDSALEKYQYLDGNRVAVTGGSYGGYMTAWLVTQSDRFKAAISQRGVYEFINFGMTTDIAIWFEYQYDGEILDRFSEFWKDQPIAHVKNIKTPLLIIHSENDYRVPIGTAEQLFWLGKRYGKVVELVRYPRDGHELSRSGEPRHIVDRINRIVNWINKFNK